MSQTDIRSQISTGYAYKSSGWYLKQISDPRNPQDIGVKAQTDTYPGYPQDIRVISQTDIRSQIFTGYTYKISGWYRKQITDSRYLQDMRISYQGDIANRYQIQEIHKISGW